MITYATHKDKLMEINPFYPWQYLDHKIQHVKEKRIFKYDHIGISIPWEQMQYNDSVFIPMKPEIWRKIRRTARESPYIKIMYAWGRERKPGVRIWSRFVRPTPMRKPLKTYRLAA